jgi:hypothetical protein
MYHKSKQIGEISNSGQHLLLEHGATLPSSGTTGFCGLNFGGFSGFSFSSFGSFCCLCRFGGFHFGLFCCLGWFDFFNGFLFHRFDFLSGHNGWSGNWSDGWCNCGQLSGFGLSVSGEMSGFSLSHFRGVLGWLEWIHCGYSRSGSSNWSSGSWGISNYWGRSDGRGGDSGGGISSGIGSCGGGCSGGCFSGDGLTLSPCSSGLCFSRLSRFSFSCFRFCWLCFSWFGFNWFGFNWLRFDWLGLDGLLFHDWFGLGFGRSNSRSGFHWSRSSGSWRTFHRFNFFDLNGLGFFNWFGFTNNFGRSGGRSWSGGRSGSSDSLSLTIKNQLILN